MMKEPWFWRDRSFAGRAVAASLAPGAAVYDAARRWRARRIRAERPPLPVLCVGAATLGGVGKTPFAIMLAGLLRADGHTPHFLTRGYGGALAGPVLVDPDRHDARAVGDEALLLARVAPTVVARDRRAGARMAAESGADVVVMDDGYQNPSLAKTAAILLADAADPVGNGQVFPAGPLREPLSSALARADALVFTVAAADSEVAAHTYEMAAGRPVFRVWVEPAARFDGEGVAAFCGIGAPERFFATLEKAGARIVFRAAFPDHHVYSQTEMERLRMQAAAAGARLVTTEKDFARLPDEQRAGIASLPVAMRCDAPDALAAFIAGAIARFNQNKDGNG